MGLSSNNMSSLSILCFFLVSLALFSPSPAAGDDELSVYDALEEYNFPIGLLPKGVTGYELDKSTGKFEVYLGETCEFYVEDYRLKYKSTISGVISKNELKNLKGISVKVLFLWLNINEVSRYDDELSFSVGLLSANFGLENFEECPQCGCGFDCDDVDGKTKAKKDGEWYLNRFMLSS